MGRTGRPSSLTPEVQEHICTAMRSGHYLESAAALANVSHKTVYSWLQKGDLEDEGIYVDFSIAYRKACAEAVQRALGVIEEASYSSWQAAAWFLERRQPNHWGRRDPEASKYKELKAEIQAMQSLPDAELKKLAGSEGNDEE